MRNSRKYFKIWRSPSVDVGTSTLAYHLRGIKKENNIYKKCVYLMYKYYSISELVCLEIGFNSNFIFIFISFLLYKPTSHQSAFVIALIRSNSNCNDTRVVD